MGGSTGNVYSDYLRLDPTLSDCSNRVGYRCKEHRVQSALDNSYLNYRRQNYGKALGTQSCSHYSFVCPT